METLSPFCEVYRRGIEILGRRWTGAILRALMAGRTRFNDIAHTIPGVSRSAPVRAAEGTRGGGPARGARSLPARPYGSNTRSRKPVRP